MYVEVLWGLLGPGNAQLRTGVGILLAFWFQRRYIMCFGVWGMLSSGSIQVIRGHVPDFSAFYIERFNHLTLNPI